MSAIAPVVTERKPSVSLAEDQKFFNMSVIGPYAITALISPTCKVYSGGLWTKLQYKERVFQICCYKSCEFSVPLKLDGIVFDLEKL